MERYGKPHPYHNYIHRIRGHNPCCSSKHGAYWSDPFLLDIKVILTFHFNVSFSAMPVVPCKLNYKSSTCIHARTLAFFTN